MLFATLLCITSCSSGFLNGGSSRLDRLEGQWTWSNGIDSLWVELKKTEREPIKKAPYDNYTAAISGRYNLYIKGVLITGNYENKTIGGLIKDDKIHELIIFDRSEPNYSYLSHLLLSNPTKNKLKWELGGIPPIRGIRAWSAENPPPQPITGFKLPNDIVLTRLKE